MYENALNDATDLTFRGAYILMKDESIPLLDRVRVCLPLAMKRIPDKQEVLQMNLSLDQDTAKQLLERAERNSLIYKELQEEDKQLSCQDKYSEKQIGGLPPTS
jgi:hypothetical protein